MSKLADILFKPIGIVVSADKVQIIRPNGDKISCAKECYFFLGDKIVNNSDEDVEVTINGEKVKLEPKESTTVVSIDQKTIDNIALLQKELAKGKSIDELEESAAGKEIIKAIDAVISDIKFMESGHYSNIHAQNGDIDFSDSNEAVEITFNKEMNVEAVSTGHKSNPPIFSPHGGSSTPNVPWHNVIPSTPREKPEEHYNRDGFYLRFVDDKNHDSKLTAVENNNPGSVTKVRAILPTDAKENDTILFDRVNYNIARAEINKATLGEVKVTKADLDRGYAEFDVPFYRADTTSLNIDAKLLRDDESGNRMTVDRTTGRVLVQQGDSIKIEYTEDTNKDGKLTLFEAKDPETTTTARIHFYNMAKVGDIIKIDDDRVFFNGINTDETKILTEEDLARKYIDFEVPAHWESQRDYFNPTTIRAALIRGTDIISGTKSDITAQKVPPIPEKDMWFLEDRDGDGVIRSHDHRIKPEIEHLTLRVKLASFLKAGDQITFMTERGDVTLTEENIKDGYVDIYIPFRDGESKELYIAQTHLGMESEDTIKRLTVEKFYFPKLSTDDITFLDDTNHDGRLSLSELTNPITLTATTKVRVNIPRDAYIGDLLMYKTKVFDKRDSKEITQEDYDRGYVDFDIPLDDKSIADATFYFRDENYFGEETTKEIVVDGRMTNFLNFYRYIDDYNYRDEITDQNPWDGKKKVAFRLGGGEKLNDGYEVEFEVNGKVIKTHKKVKDPNLVDDGSTIYEAEIDVNDIKNDPTHRVIAKLKNATYDEKQSDGTIVTVNAPATSEYTEYSVDIQNTEIRVRDQDFTSHFGAWNKPEVTLADIKNNIDIPLKGKVTGNYSAGENVVARLPNGHTINMPLDADGNFSHTFKPSDFGFPTTFDPTTYGSEYDDIRLSLSHTHNGKRTEFDKSFKLNIQTPPIGLVPSFEVAEDNNSGVEILKYDNLIGSMQAHPDKYSNTIAVQNSTKIYDDANGGKLKLNLDFGVFPQRRQYNINSLTENAKKEISEAADGWKYEVYLLKSTISDEEYKNLYPIKGSSVATKIIEGTIVNGQTKYIHDFNIKDFVPTKGETNERLSVYVKIIPPAGSTTYKHVESDTGTMVHGVDQGSDLTTFSADGVLKFNNEMDNATNFDDFYFFSHLNIFNSEEATRHAYYDQPTTIIEGGEFGYPVNYDRKFAKNFGLFAPNSDTAHNTFYYTNSVDKINLSGFPFNDAYNKYNSKDISDQGVWNGINIKPERAYVIVNGVKYNGIIDDEMAYINIKGVKTIDLKNDPDHIIEYYVITKDHYGNDVTAIKKVAYNVIDSENLTMDEIEKGFVLSGTSNPILPGGYGTNSVTNYTRAGLQPDYDNGLISKSENEPRILTLLHNKYVSHFDHDIVLKVVNNVPGDMNNQMLWYDPSDKKIKEVINGEILVKAGTNFNDIRIVQSLDSGSFKEPTTIDKTTNEFGGITEYSNMGVRTNVITTSIILPNGEKIASQQSYMGDSKYDVEFYLENDHLNLADYAPNSVFNDRKVSFNKEEGAPKYKISGMEQIRGTVEFLNKNLEVTLVRNDPSNPYSSPLIKEMLLRSGNNTINIENFGGYFNVNKISHKRVVTEEEEPNYSLTLNRANGDIVHFSGNSFDFQNLHLLKGQSTAANKNILFSIDENSTSTFNNFKSNENIEISYRIKNSYNPPKKNIYMNHFVLNSNGENYIPELIFKQNGSNTSWTGNRIPIQEIAHITNSVIAGNIVDGVDFDIKKSIIGVEGSTTPIKIEARGDFSISDDSKFVGPVEIKNSENYGNKYYFDIAIDNEFTLTDTTNLILNTYTLEYSNNTFTFGSHAKIGSHATFNVDHSTMTFENGSVFEGTIKSGTNTNNFVIKAGATFNGTIEMADAINNITIEDGAILGPNFHITETNTESEAVNAKYDTLTLFNDIDFTNLDVKGLDQINIGTKARGEMINMDIVFDELNSLLGGGKNTIKFWGDNDNHLTFHNEANRTFSVAADQSAVASQPYTRYEATDTASGTKYFIDVHNDINLQIL